MNETLWIKLQAFIAGGITTLAAVTSQELTSLLLLMVIDIATGLAVGTRGRRLASSAFARGLRIKVGELAIAFVAIIAHRKMGLPDAALYFTIGGLCFKEIFSVIENAKMLGVDVAWLRPMFERFAAQKVSKNKSAGRWVTNESTTEEVIREEPATTNDVSP